MRPGEAGHGPARLGKAWRGKEQGPLGIVPNGDTIKPEDRIVMTEEERIDHQTDDSEAKLYFRGVPTQVDVDALINALGIPKPGDTISCEAVAEIIKVDTTEHRFNTVSRAWRKQLEREHNLLLVSNRDGGFVALTNSGRIHHACNVADNGLRRISRASVVARKTSTDGLSEEERRAADHLVNTTGQMMAMAAASAQKLPLPKFSLSINR